MPKFYVQLYYHDGTIIREPLKKNQAYFESEHTGMIHKVYDLLDEWGHWLLRADLNLDTYAFVSASSFTITIPKDGLRQLKLLAVMQHA